MFGGLVLRSNRLLLRRRLHEITRRTLLSVTFSGTKQRRLLVVDASKRMGHFSGKDPRIALQAAASSLQEQAGDDGSKNATLNLRNMLQVQKRRFEELYLVDSKDLDRDQAIKELNTIAQLWLDYWRSSGMHNQQEETLGPTEMLFWIDELSERSANAIRPDLSIFHHLLNGVIAQAANRKTNDKRMLFQRRKLGELLLGRMLQLVSKRDEHDDEKQSPCTVNLTHQFNKVMTLSCQANDVAAAEKLLRELVSLHDSEEFVDEDKRMFPLGIDSFTTVIGAWAKRGSPREAENVLIWMTIRAESALAKGKKDILMPNRDAFETCLNAWVNASDMFAGKRAELVLLKMIDLHEQTRNTSFPSNTKPDIRSCSKVVAAWVKSRHSNATFRADKILHLMHDPDLSTELGNESFQNIMADSYLQVIKQWSLSGQQNAPQKCSELLSRLDDLVGLKNVKPVKLQKMYAAIIHAWARSRDIHRTSHAQALFNEMERQRKPGGLFSVDADFCWHHSIYDALFQAYSKSGDGKKAEWLLSKMLQEYFDYQSKAKGQEGGPKKPDVKSLNAVILAWSRSNDPGALERAEKVFNTMTELGSTVDPKMRPDVVSYNGLLSTMAGTKNVDLARRGERYFQQIKCDSSCNPTIVTYKHAILLWLNVRSPEALQKVQSLIAEMEAGDQSIWPDVSTYKMFLAVLKKSDLAEDEKRRRTEYVEMQIKALRG